MDMASFQAPPGAAHTPHFEALLDAGIVAARSHDRPRDYLGGSRLGEACERRLGYEYRHTPKDAGRDFTGRTLRIFARGHDCEARMAGYLRMAGFALVERGPDGNQIGFAVARDPETGHGRIAGHIDGLITGWVDPGQSGDAGAWASALPFPMIWENKGVKHKKFLEVQEKGLRIANPIYFTQCHIYMAYKQVPFALFTSENQDTCEVYCELIPFDRQVAQDASDRGVRVISARDVSELPRIARDPTDWRCRFCDYAERCWSDAARTDTHTAPLPSGWGAWK